MVRISDRAVTSRNAKPMAPTRLALAENWFSPPMTWRAIDSGNRLSDSHCCITPCSLLKAGNAENTASNTVNNGTSEITVVKVRLLAVRPRWSSRKRSRRVRAVSSQGKSLRACKVCHHA